MLILKEHNQYYYRDCHKAYLCNILGNDNAVVKPNPFYFKNNKEALCFNANISYGENGIDKISLEMSYYIGLQYVKEWEIPILIQPKLNTNSGKLNFYRMMEVALSEPENFNHLSDLMDINFEDDWIEVPPNTQVELTPLLLIQFLMAVKQLVRKGLKKSYYPKRENLKSRIKGKILVGQQVKNNVYKNRLTYTVCQYQEFGFDTTENRFIKYVLRYVYAHLSNYQYEGFKKPLKELLNYNLAAFGQVTEEKFKYYNGKESNPFYKIYNTVFDLGNQILKLLSYSYEKSTQKPRKYPPHWIDMSKLFELYVYKKLREKYDKPGEVKYHFKTNYQELDYIINSNGFQAVVDAKYKPRYKYGNPSKEDARQVSGYARLNSVYKELKIESDITIPIYFIFPKELIIPVDEINSMETNTDEETVIIDNLDSIFNSTSEVRKVKAYKKMFLQEIELPIFKTS